MQGTNEFGKEAALGATSLVGARGALRWLVVMAMAMAMAMTVVLRKAFLSYCLRQMITKGSSTLVG